jgi:hypothetical protein
LNKRPVVHVVAQPRLEKDRGLPTPYTVEMEAMPSHVNEVSWGRVLPEVAALAERLVHSTSDT